MWNHARPMLYSRLRLRSVIKTKTSDSTQLHAFEGIKTLDNKTLRPKPELRVIKVGICPGTPLPFRMVCMDVFDFEASPSRVGRTDNGWQLPSTLAHPRLTGG